jgi:hypothetical protein
MRADTTAFGVELPAIFRDLFRIAPWEWWRRRERELDAREQRNPYLAEYFDDKFPLERALTRAMAYRRATSRYPSINDSADVQYYQLYSFAFAVVRTHANLSPRGQTRLCGYLKDGLKSDSGLAPVALEMAAAVHFWAADFDVELTDMEDRGQFDFLASGEGIEMEVDCKTVSGDIGRSIHRLRMLDLFRRCQPAIRACLARGGGTIIRIIIPAALHGREEYMKSVVALAIAAAEQEKTLGADGVATVEVTRFQLDQDLFHNQRKPIQAELAHLVGQYTGNANPHAMSVHRPGEGAVVIAIESNRPDKVVEGIYRALKDSAERQFTRTRPALLAVRLTDLTNNQLLGLTSREHGLAAISSRLFASLDRQHLFGVVFLSPSQSLTEVPLTDQEAVRIQNRGSAVLFRNHKYPLATDPRFAALRLFAAGTTLP